MLRNFNSVQLNIVTFFDVQKALRNNSIDGCVYMMDNSPNSQNKGTNKLRTVCKQGQVLNWIIYPMDSEKRLDGTYPPFVKINNIVFFAKDSDEPSNLLVCSDCKIYGPPDKMRTQRTPNYYYWAGTVLSDLTPGVYKYRIIFEVETEDKSKKVYFNLDSPAIDVVKIC